MKIKNTKKHWSFMQIRKIINDTYQVQMQSLMQHILIKSLRTMERKLAKPLKKMVNKRMVI